MSRDPEDTVRTVLRSRGSLSEDDLGEMLGCFTEDAVWHNVPVKPVVGREAIAAFLRQAVPFPEKLEIEIKSIATRGTTVFVEHTDTHRGAGREIVMPCCGVFETENGLIREWRDYFDLRTWIEQGGT